MNFHTLVQAWWRGLCELAMLVPTEQEVTKNRERVACGFILGGVRLLGIKVSYVSGDHFKYQGFFFFRQDSNFFKLVNKFSIF
jgi:hypothetical protein